MNKENTLKSSNEQEYNNSICWKKKKLQFEFFQIRFDTTFLVN